LLDETPGEAVRLFKLYRGLLDGSSTGDAVWHELKVESKLGVTLGTLSHGRSGS
jgi:hypothetical protein